MPRDWCSLTIKRACILVNSYMPGESFLRPGQYSVRWESGYWIVESIDRGVANERYVIDKNYIRKWNELIGN